MQDALTSLKAMVLGYLNKPGVHSVPDLCAKALLTFTEANYILSKMQEDDLAKLDGDIILPGSKASSHDRMPIFAPLARAYVGQIKELVPEKPIDVQDVLKQVRDKVASG